jgi:hypothetical protein
MRTQVYHPENKAVGVSGVVPEASSEDGEDNDDEGEELDVQVFVDAVRDRMRDLPTLVGDVVRWEQEAEDMHYLPRRFVKQLCRFLRESLEHLHGAGGATLPPEEFLAPALRNDFYIVFVLTNMLPLVRDMSWVSASTKTQKRRRTNPAAQPVQHLALAQNKITHPE